MPDHEISHLTSGQVRKTGTIGRPHLIDTAHIRSGVEKLTGLAAIHPIAIAIEVQPFLPEGIRFHIEVFGNPPDILFGEGRGHLPTTIGTGQAVDLLPYFSVNFLNDTVQPDRRLFLYPCEESAHAALLFGDLVAE